MRHSSLFICVCGTLLPSEMWSRELRTLALVFLISLERIWRLPAKLYIWKSKKSRSPFGQLQTVIQCPVYIESSALLFWEPLDTFVIYFRILSHGAFVLPLRVFLLCHSFLVQYLYMCTCGYVDLVFFFWFPHVDTLLWGFLWCPSY